jgi:hypothetical protein
MLSQREQPGPGHGPLTYTLRPAACSACLQTEDKPAAVAVTFGALLVLITASSVVDTIVSHCRPLCKALGSCVGLAFSAVPFHWTPSAVTSWFAARHAQCVWPTASTPMQPSVQNVPQLCCWFAPSTLLVHTLEPCALLVP